MSVSAAVFVTASYAPDFERCKMLCESMDRYVTGSSHHYILAAHGDVALFKPLESAHRTVVDERAILPAWLHDLPDPLSGFKRRIWLSLRTPPLRGWHVQQLRRIAFARHVEAETLIYCDSDVVFFRPFDASAFVSGGKTRLFRRDHELARAGAVEQRVWSAQAGRVLGVPDLAGPGHDYIATLISWRRETVLAMCSHMESLHSCSWISAMTRGRRFSECMIYGRYVDDVTAGADHFHDSAEFCRTYWNGPHMDEAALGAFIESAEPWQSALGLQSFIGIEPAVIRRLTGL